MSGKRHTRNTVDAKKSAAGRQGKGVNAFQPKLRKKDKGLQARIDMIVKRALEQAEKGSGFDVVIHESGGLHLHHAQKVG